MSFAAVGIVVLGLVISHAMGNAQVKAAAMQVPLIVKMANAAVSGWTKACGVYLCPLFAAYLGLSALNQAVRARRVRGPGATARFFSELAKADPQGRSAPG
jgi:hypothetical protein